MKDVKIIPYQKKFSYSYSLGVYPTLELVKHHPENVLKIVFSSRGKQNAGVKKLFDFCLKNKIRSEWNDGLILKVGGTPNTYAVGVFEKYQSKLRVGENHIVLVCPEDPGNVGGIFRSALAFGVPNVGLVRPCVDPFDPKAIRSSMGGVFSVNFEYFDNLKEYEIKHKNMMYGFVTEGGIDVQSVAFSSPFALVFGSESSGLFDEDIKICKKIQIRQSSLVDSLNLSVAVGIGLYEATK